MWKPVHDKLAAVPGVQVCGYDRAGLGWSESYPGPFSIEQEVDALHEALEKLQLGERRILAGASYGGFMIRAYANRYPDHVAGLVYADPNTVYFFDKHPEIVKEMEAAKVPGLVHLALPGMIRQAVRKKLRAATDLPKHELNELAAAVGTKKHMRAAVKYSRAFGSVIDHMRTLGNPDVPTVVITRGLRDESDPWIDETRERDWRSGHKTLLEGVSDARHVSADSSRHGIPYDEPDVIVSAILDMVDLQARTASNANQG